MEGWCSQPLPQRAQDLAPRLGSPGWSRMSSDCSTLVRRIFGPSTHLKSGCPDDLSLPPPKDGQVSFIMRTTWGRSTWDRDGFTHTACQLLADLNQLRTQCSSGSLSSLTSGYHAVLCRDGMATLSTQLRSPSIKSHCVSVAVENMSAGVSEKQNLCWLRLDYVQNGIDLACSCIFIVVSVVFITCQGWISFSSSWRFARVSFISAGLCLFAAQCMCPCIKENLLRLPSEWAGEWMKERQRQRDPERQSENGEDRGKHRETERDRGRKGHEKKRRQRNNLYLEEKDGTLVITCFPVHLRTSSAHFWAGTWIK